MPRRPTGRRSDAEIEKLAAGACLLLDYSPHPQAPTNPAPSRPRLSLVGDAADCAAWALAERLPAPGSPAKAPAKAPPTYPPPPEAPPPAAPRLKLTPAQAARRQQREQREANAARAERLNRLAHDLVARYPQTFTDPPVPLAIGVDKPLIAALAGIWSAKAVRHFLRFWAGRPAYVAAIAAGEPRCDLDGTPTTAPTEREREHATAAMAGAWGRYL